MVRGTITTEAGVPVEGAEVEVTVIGASSPDGLPLERRRLGACEGPAFPPSRSVTDRAGRYLQLHDHGAAPEFDACITVHVVPPASTRLVPGMASGVRLRFRARHPSAPPRDTAYVGVVLRNVEAFPGGGRSP